MDAANKLVEKGVPIERIKFTEALRPRHVYGKNTHTEKAIVDTCNNCKATWPEENFR